MGAAAPVAVSSWLIPLLTTAASAGIGYHQNRKTANEAAAANSAGLRRQAETQRIANARINRTLTDARAVDPEDSRRTAQQQYMNVIRAKQGQANAGLAGQGVSSAYDQAAGAAAAATPQYAAGIGDLMSRIDAGDDQRRREGNLFGDMEMDLSPLARNVQQDDFLTRLRIGRIQRNPWLDALGAGLGAYGSNYTPGGGTTTYGFGSPGSVARSIGPRP